MVGQLARHGLDRDVLQPVGVEHAAGRLGAGQPGAVRHLAVLVVRPLDPALRPEHEHETGDHEDEVKWDRRTSNRVPFLKAAGRYEKPRPHPHSDEPGSYRANIALFARAAGAPVRVLTTARPPRCRGEGYSPCWVQSTRVARFVSRLSRFAEAPCRPCATLAGRGGLWYAARSGARVAARRCRTRTTCGQGLAGSSRREILHSVQNDTGRGCQVEAPTQPVILSEREGSRSDSSQPAQGKRVATPGRSNAWTPTTSAPSAS